jgi:hypothetical protein
MYVYGCGGVILIPLAIPHAMALRWLHLKYEKWAPSAGRRAIRQTFYGIACAGLLLVAEGRTLYQKHRRYQVECIASNFGVQLPSGTVLLGRREAGAEHFRDIQEAHFRVDGKMPWPPFEGARPLSKQENLQDVRARLSEIAGQEISGDAELDQVKWMESSGWVHASRLRTREGDFVEFARKRW